MYISKNTDILNFYLKDNSKNNKAKNKSKDNSQ